MSLLRDNWCLSVYPQDVSRNLSDFSVNQSSLSYESFCWPCLERKKVLPLTTAIVFMNWYLHSSKGGILFYHFHISRFYRITHKFSTYENFSIINLSFPGTLELIDGLLEKVISHGNLWRSKSSSSVMEEVLNEEFIRISDSHTDQKGKMSVYKGRKSCLPYSETMI